MRWPMEAATVLFDASCSLCRRTRAYGDGHGRPGLLRFVPNDAPEAQGLLEAHGLTGQEADTLVVVAGGRAYTHSAAVVQIARRLRLPHRLGAALWLVPRPVRDAGYRFVARRRHRVQG